MQNFTLKDLCFYVNAFVCFLFLFISSQVYASYPFETNGLGVGSAKTCPSPPDCHSGAVFLSLDAANQCQCCACHGDAVGCAGGFKGRIICSDGTIADNCACQMLVKPRKKNPTIIG